MTMRKAEDLDAIRHQRGKSPRVFVESGTFHGKTTRWALDRFAVVHTVELSAELYRQAVKTLAPLGAICHQGDTRDVIPRLARELDEPVFWFLDAHWFNRPHVAGHGTPLPLADELAALGARPHADVIVVDDRASFGRDEHQAGWGEVSLEWLARQIPGSQPVAYKDVAVIHR